LEEVGKEEINLNQEIHNATKMNNSKKEGPEKKKQSLSKNEGTIFAYLRRSTKKEEQRDSKEKQNDCIDIMARDLWIEIESIRIFEDDFTWFKITTRNGTPVTKRPWYKALMEEIDKCKKPCILLVYDVSRLARNIPDGTIICEKLWLHGNINKKRIEYIRFYDGTRWDSKTQEEEIYTAFLRANSYSSALAKKKQDSNIASLIRGIMPKTIKAPPWLTNTDRGMKENEFMPRIRKAFEMKAEWRLEKEISKYLSLYGINIKTWNLMTLVWSKTQYIWEYTHPKTWEVFENLKFTSGNTAISRDLWNRTHKRIGKKAGGYWEWQQGDIIRELLKWGHDKDKAFSVELKKGKFKSYKSNAYGGFNRTELKILKEFLRTIPEKVVDLYIELEKSFYDSEYHKEKYQDRLNELGKIEAPKEFTVKLGDKLATMSQTDREYWKKILERHDLISKRITALRFGKEETAYDTLTREEMQEAIINYTKEETLYIYGKEGGIAKKMTEALLRWEDIEYPMTAEMKKREEIMILKIKKTQKTKKFLDYSRELEEWEIKVLEMLADYNTEEWKNTRISERDIYTSQRKEVADIFAKYLQEISWVGKEEEELRSDRKKSLENEIEKKSQIIKSKHVNLVDLFASWDITKEDFDMLKTKMEDEKWEIEILKKELESISRSSDIEEFFDRLPDILWKTFELSSKVLSTAEIQGMKEDILKLIEICTFELEINNKKELKIKLFDALEGVMYPNGGRYRIRTYIAYTEGWFPTSSINTCT
jgi:Resolvase, N terminal domain